MNRLSEEWVFTGSCIGYDGPVHDLWRMSVSRTSRISDPGVGQYLRRITVALAALLVPGSMLDVSGARPAAAVAGNYRNWTLEEAVGMLTNSPWARKETYTRIIGGIGSGLSGEKEIYSTFFVRFLSAGPIREAYARVSQIQGGYDQMSREEQRKFDSAIEPGLKLDVRQWIVVALSFRSNDQSLEHRVKQFLEQFNIGAIAMVGTLSQGSRLYGLVRDPNGGVHRVQMGDYMGMDNGKILAIDENRIELLEIVSDGTGGWVERERTVNLGGGAQS